jgi:lactoylglutathione lyase
MKITMKNVVIFVRDLAIAKEFYIDRLRLPLVQETQMMLEFFPGEGPKFGVALAMHEAAFPLVGRHTGITLTVEDIVTLCRELSAAGVKFAEPLEASPWGKMAVVEDPDGNQIALVDR